MKKIITEALKNRQKVTFYFNEMDYFVATTLIDIVADNDNFIYVGTSKPNRNNLINLNETRRIHILN